MPGTVLDASLRILSFTNILWSRYILILLMGKLQSKFKLYNLPKYALNDRGKIHIQTCLISKPISIMACCHWKRNQHWVWTYNFFKTWAFSPFLATYIFVVSYILNNIRNAKITFLREFLHLGIGGSYIVQCHD